MGYINFSVWSTTWCIVCSVCIVIQQTVVTWTIIRIFFGFILLNYCGLWFFLVLITYLILTLKSYHELYILMMLASCDLVKVYIQPWSLSLDIWTSIFVSQVKYLRARIQCLDVFCLCMKSILKWELYMSTSVIFSTFTLRTSWSCFRTACTSSFSSQLNSSS